MEPKEPDRRKRSLVTRFTDKEEMGALGGALGRLWLQMTAPQELLDLRDKAEQMEAQLHEQRVQIEALQAEQEALTAQAEQDQAQIQALEQQLAARQAQVQLLLDQAKEDYVAAARAAVAEKDSGQASRWNSLLLRIGKIIVQALALLVGIAQGPQVVEWYRERYGPVLRTLPTQLREQIMEWIEEHLGEVQAQPASPLAAPESPLDSPLPEPEPEPVEEPEPISIDPREPEMVHIPAGYFLMGDDKRRVYLDAYHIGKYPVTVAQFAAFVAATNYQTRAKEESNYTWRTPRGLGSNVVGKEAHPVTRVSWDDANAYCTWLSRTTGRTYQLPTEKQWEKAARGTDGRIYPWGNQPPTDKLCNFNKNVGDTTPVGRYSPQGDSPYGVADMAGNVWEWCEDWYDDEHNLRVVRGGSWYSTPDYTRAGFRFGDAPNSRFDYGGLRVVVAGSPGF